MMLTFSISVEPGMEDKSVIKHQIAPDAFILPRVLRERVGMEEANYIISRRRFVKWPIPSNFENGFIGDAKR